MAILDKARTHLEKALEIDPEFAQARLALAALRSFDDADEALAVLRIERRANLNVEQRASMFGAVVAQRRQMRAGDQVQATILRSSFFQGDPDQRSGMGLGLAIARRVINAHGGRIEITDAEGSTGTCVMVSLPLCEARQARA